MSVEMSNDYYQEGYGSVLDYMELIYYADVPYSFGWICFLKLDNGRYGIARISRNDNEGFDWPAPIFDYYNPAIAYWRSYKARREADQQKDMEAYIKRKQLLAHVS